MDANNYKEYVHITTETTTSANAIIPYYYD